VCYNLRGPGRAKLDKDLGDPRINDFRGAAGHLKDAAKLILARFSARSASGATARPKWLRIEEFLQVSGPSADFQGLADQLTFPGGA
jgi:hypothetical protein